MFRLSTHSIEKHLFNRSSDASLFFNKSSMMDSIQQCLTSPDKASVKLNKLILEKKMSEDIGVLGFAQTYTQKLRVICNPSKDFIISAYPIK